jgi:dTDP-4-dehydrorhamnose 3,5-epimerase
VRDSGHLTELLRSDWFEEGVEIDQVFQITLEGRAVSAWHVHVNTMDRLFVNVGQVKVVLYDGRPTSPTRGAINEFHLGERRPGLVVVPPGVWHGLRNLLDTRSCVINAVDRAYTYEAPDHWRLPRDTPEIPYVI